MKVSTGKLPADESCTGFQNVFPGRDVGYLTLFCGIDSPGAGKSINLRFIRNKIMQIEKLMTGESETIVMNNDGVFTPSTRS